MSRSFEFLLYVLSLVSTLDTLASHATSKLLALTLVLYPIGCGLSNLFLDYGFRNGDGRLAVVFVHIFLSLIYVLYQIRGLLSTSFL
jgi:hypothetical protein